MIRKMYGSLPPGYIFKSTVKVMGGGAALFLGYELLSMNEKFHESTVMPMAHKALDAESAHLLAVKMAKHGILTGSAKTLKEYPELNCTVFEKEFRNPIGIAAGFDKNGEAIKSLRKSGLGFVEIGSVTPLPQRGNEKPRVFRLLEDKAVINRYGFNNDGVGVVSQRVMKAYAPTSNVPLGVNLGKNKLTKEAEHDYEIGTNYFAPYCDYLVVNVSSPNTPGLRALQNKKELRKILRTVHATIKRDGIEKEKRPKVLLKISPDLIESERREIAYFCLDRTNGVDGLIVGNSTITRPSTLQSDKVEETGGLSGLPLKQLSTECVREMYKLTRGKVPIVGVGGVASGKDAYEKIRAGASLVQFYTALVYQGFPVTGKIKRELVECLRRDGFSNVQEAVGADHKLATVYIDPLPFAYLGILAGMIISRLIIT